MNDIKYVIVPTHQLQNIDFDQVLQDSAHTVRTNAENTLAVLKYRGEMPSSIAVLGEASTEYSHEQIMMELNTSDWTPQTTETGNI